MFITMVVAMNVTMHRGVFGGTINSSPQRVTIMVPRMLEMLYGLAMGAVMMCSLMLAMLIFNLLVCVFMLILMIVLFFLPSIMLMFGKGSRSKY